MKNNYKNLYVFNPDTNTPVQAEDWLKDADPTRAQLFGFKSGDGILLMTKNPISYDVTFDEAQKLAADFSIEGKDLKFRCITRREVIDYQDALDEGLTDLVKAIGGDASYGWIWTSERDAKDGWFARRNGATTAWLFYSAYGSLHLSYVGSANRCQAVSFYPTQS